MQLSTRSRHVRSPSQPSYKAVTLEAITHNANAIYYYVLLTTYYLLLTTYFLLLTSYYLSQPSYEAVTLEAIHHTADEKIEYHIDVVTGDLPQAAATPAASVSE